MFCTEENRKTCREEKLGCEGCFYNKQELKIGEYIRTKKGTIDRVKKHIQETHMYVCENLITIDPENKLATHLEDIEHNEKLENLVKIGDYINGTRVDGLEKLNGSVTIIWLENMTDIEPDEIESILTKEKAEKYTYRLEEKI